MADVLIVDASLTVRMDLKHALEGEHCSTVLCDSLAAARSEVVHKPFGVIVLDLMLADGDGLEFLRELKTNDETRHVPVMLLASEDEVRRRLDQSSIAADAYAPKPYDRVHIVNRVKWLMQRNESVMQNEPTSELLRTQRILAIDDSSTYQHELAKQLEHDRLDVLHASSGEQGLELLAAHHVDAVLLDLLMPGLSGEETCRRIKGSVQWRGIPVLMLTGAEDRESMIASFNAGADDFIPKSSEFSVLRARLRAQLRRKRFEEETARMRSQLHQKEIEAAEANANRELAEARASLLADLERKNKELHALYSELDERANSLELAKQEADIANQAKDNFLAVLSHELRTPLTPVLAAVSLIEKSDNLSDDLRQNLEIIRRNVGLEARLIDDLLDVTRIVRGKLTLEETRLDITEVIEQAAEICRPDIEGRALSLQIDMPERPYWVTGDASRLQQVFWNLLNNSIKFTPPGGSIAIRCYREDSKVGIEIADSGIGIDETLLPRIFDAFEQGEKNITRQFGGLGLGLAITARLVKLHHGSIFAYSAGKGQDSSFKVLLPLSALEAEAQGGSTGGHKPHRLKPSSIRILLVEDHADTALMMRLVLENSGHQVETAADVAQALAALNGQQFDLIISDLGLPDRSGLELFQELRRRGDKTKGIALSGFGREEDVLKSKEAGFVAHLTKPIDVSILEETVARVTEQEGRCA